MLQAGLYQNNELIYPFEKLVNDFGLDIEKDYLGKEYLHIKSSGHCVFEDNNLSGVLVLPEDVLYIGYCAFYKTIGLEGVIFQTRYNEVTEINDFAFGACSDLKFVKMNYTRLGNFVFTKDDNLEKVKLYLSTNRDLPSRFFNKNNKLKIYVPDVQMDSSLEFEDANKDRIIYYNDRDRFATLDELIAKFSTLDKVHQQLETNIFLDDNIIY